MYCKYCNTQIDNVCGDTKLTKAQRKVQMHKECATGKFKYVFVNNGPNTTRGLAFNGEWPKGQEEAEAINSAKYTKAQARIARRKGYSLVIDFLANEKKYGVPTEKKPWNFSDLYWIVLRIDKKTVIKDGHCTRGRSRNTNKRIGDQRRRIAAAIRKEDKMVNSIVEPTDTEELDDSVDEEPEDGKTEITFETQEDIF